MAVTVSDKALRELVREALDNKEFSGWAANHDGSASVDAQVDPSQAVTDPINPNFTPQTKTELGIAVGQLVKNLPDTEMPAIYKTVKHALEINAKKEDEEDMEKKAAQGGTKQVDAKSVEEAVRTQIRQALKALHEAPVDPADAQADADPDEPEDAEGKPKRKLNTVSDVGGASFEEIAKELGFSVAGAKQAVDKALEKAQFIAQGMTEDDREIMVRTAMGDYIKMLAKTGELTGSDVQLMKDHPSIVRELDGFREFLHNHIRRVRRSDQQIENPLGENDELDERDSNVKPGDEISMRSVAAPKPVSKPGTTKAKSAATGGNVQVDWNGLDEQELDLEAINRACAILEYTGGDGKFQLVNDDHAAWQHLEVGMEFICKVGRERVPAKFLGWFDKKGQPTESENPDEVDLRFADLSDGMEWEAYWFEGAYCAGSSADKLYVKEM